MDYRHWIWIQKLKFGETQDKFLGSSVYYTYFRIF